ncbi:hypothetical protein GVN20_29435, partial [Runella sp. CRIBMP]|uniref:SdrD B-like domain-containing protein n=1 Tax=Runella sp. CRIBMP TaxID=2683261 RepID=UPI00197D1C20
SSSATSTVTGLVPGVYQFIWATSATCSDTVEITIPTCTQTPKTTSWNFTCADGVKVDVVSKGVGQSEPDPNCTSSGTATMAIPNGNTADSIYVEAVYETGDAGPTITFKDAANNSYTAYRFSIGNDEYVYRTKIPATTSVSITDNTDFCKLQSLVAYLFRKAPGYASVGLYTCESGYRNTVTLNLSLPTRTSNSDITVCVPISELSSDGRPLQIKVTAGSIVKDTTITGPDLTLGACCVATPKFTLIDVLPSTSTIKIELISPTNPDGQSHVAGAFANILCEKAVPKGSLGDFVWKDTNNNGIQDETTPNAGGVAGVQVELYKVGTTAAIAKDTTDATGKYLFTNLDAGQYYIKILAASLPAGCTISTMK